MATLRRIARDLPMLPEWMRCRFLRVRTRTWFGTNLDNHDTPASCPSIGRQVTELTTP
jgi:hypothetical protein